jgi:DNA helicase-2/ATP-dependent DNA helicase PcrA
LIYCYELLQIKEVAYKYQEMLNYIHVDEYQDTSLVQAFILKLIKAEDTKLFIVGDVDQAIYSWRGAKVENIMNIGNEFVDVETIKLEQNYRSTKNIINAANNLISHNENRYDKNLWTDNMMGQKISCHRFNGAIEEADFIQKEVEYLLNVGRKAQDIAILYRYNYQSKKIEEALMRSNISYVIYGGIRFYERMEIRDMIAYLRLILNNDDNISFNRIINVPKRSVGDVTLGKIRGISIEQKISYFNASEIIASKQIKRFNEIIKRYNNLDQSDFIDMFDSFLEDICYETYLLSSEDQSKVDERMDNIKEFKFAINDALKSGMDLNSYLNEILLFAEKENDETNSVVLSTVHGVKGLEFDNVYVVGMNEGKFPKHYDVLDFEMLQEDRRVAYVAITRACKKLVITNISYDYTGQYLEDSRFIKEMGLEETIIKKEGFIF